MYEQKEFNLEKGLEQKADGMALAAERRSYVLALARGVALEHARSDPRGECTADDVQVVLRENGYSSADLGNAAGAVFPRSIWVFTGKWRSSRRVSNHGHQNRVWQLRDWTPQD